MNFFLELYKLFQQESVSPFCFTYLSILHILDQYWDSGGFFFFKKKLSLKEFPNFSSLKMLFLLLQSCPLVWQVDQQWTKFI